MLDDTTQAVAVGDDDDAVMLLESREYLALPVRHDPFDALLESLCAGNVLVGNAGVAGIPRGAVRIVLGKVVRGDVEAAAPDKDLLVAIFLGCLSLVEALEHTVVLLVEPPCLLDGDPIEIHRVKYVVQGLDGPLEI